MKLRNKKTGEIIETNILYVSKYETLAELNEEWEDYEESKDRVKRMNNEDKKLDALIIIGRALSLLVCEKNRVKGLELLDELNSLGGKE